MKSSSIAGHSSSADKSPVGIGGGASQVCSRTIHSHDLCLGVEGRITLSSLIPESKKLFGYYFDQLSSSKDNLPKLKLVASVPASQKADMASSPLSHFLTDGEM